MKRIIVLVFLGILCSFWLHAQSPEDAIQAYANALKAYDEASKQLQRADLRAQKKELIRKTMSFSPEQSRAFWPIYDKYSAEMVKVNDARVTIINDYLQHYKDLSGEKAADLINRIMQVQLDMQEVKRSYVRELGKTIPAKQALRLLLLENQIDVQMDVYIAAQIPL